ncbi:Lycopene beta-cyclase [Aspergillus alliaceus]|uniref:Lycopene beta-cyclase n=1 Tax=Petromyces alliaceus TaxID=209559 RepID=UPI0012A56D00|nr:Lycopene beta-cyclase [Aspergillus alliaceus]KAB8237013.1 Lycopene beta-cyclase [Aspergillus alliaceus]
MELAYALVHVTYNLPLAGLMTLLYWPFMTRLDCQRILTLVIISLVATIPWDSYLVRHHVWTYAPDAVIGWTLYSIPLEEVLFFVIQTYNTSLVYLILTRRFVLPIYLGRSSREHTTTGASIILLTIVGGVIALLCGGLFTYIGLIIIWAGPFLLIQWLLSSSFIIAFPRSELIASIVLPTGFLWLVDTMSIKRGIWTVETHTKLGIQLWSDMDVEEAFFFLVTNVMIVFGLVSIDYAFALATCELVQSSEPTLSYPSYFQVLARFLTNKHRPNKRFVDNLARSVERLASSSQSMYMGSAMFQGPLRIDLIILYSFFRIADDLVDEAQDTETACRVIEQCDQLLEEKFSFPGSFPCLTASKGVDYPVPPALIAAIDSLPVSRLRLEHLRGLLEGFRIDLMFSDKPRSFPFATESDLDVYSFHVAGMAAASTLGLVVHHFPSHQFAKNVFLRRRVVDAGERMGQALQYINVARDVTRDASIKRVYLPTSWLKQEGLVPEDVLAFPMDSRLEILRDKALEKANHLCASARNEIAFLPKEVQGPFFATVDSYLEIGVALRQGMRPAQVGDKVKLPIARRLFVAYRSMALRQ